MPVKDRDWVVVGATAEAMLARGFQQVGRDFPVFLHPQTHEEYALARTERKSGHGYTGFVVHAEPDVTLEEDLARRDLTINAIAQAADGRLIDPHRGQADLQARVLRHVGPAFVEDPVRILRLARFAARFADFSVADETLALMREMVGSGEVDHLVPERVWQELARGLMETQPSRMIEVLRECGALARLLPEVDRLFGVPQPERWHPEGDCGRHVLQVLDVAARLQQPLPVRFACLLHDLGKGMTPPEHWPHHHGHERHSAELAVAVAERLKAPSDCRDLAEMVAREHGRVHRAAELRPATVLDLLERCDALRRPARFAAMLDACACDAFGRQAEAAPTGEADDYPPRALLQHALARVNAVDAGAIARATAERAQIPQRIREARLAALRDRAS